MQDMNKDPTYVIDASVRCALAKAVEESITAEEQGHLVLSQHYKFVAYLCRMILEEVGDAVVEKKRRVTS